MGAFSSYNEQISNVDKKKSTYNTSKTAYLNEVDTLNTIFDASITHVNKGDIYRMPLDDGKTSKRVQDLFMIVTDINTKVSPIKISINEVSIDLSEKNCIFANDLLWEVSFDSDLMIAPSTP